MPEVFPGRRVPDLARFPPPTMEVAEHMNSESNGESHADEPKRSKATTYGAATALGVGVGVALYSATSLPDWLAVGIGVAIWVGVAVGGRSKV
jgi:hypothetical protein